MPEKRSLSSNCKRVSIVKVSQLSQLYSEKISTNDTKNSFNSGNANSASESSKNFISNVYTVFWKTTDLIVEDTTCKKQMKLKPLFDQGLKQSYVTKRAKQGMS